MYMTEVTLLKDKDDLRSVQTVHAFGHFAAVVDTFGTDAFTAGVVEPAILRAAHRLTVQLTLTHRHAVIKVHNRAHFIFSIVIASMDAVAGKRDVLMRVFRRLQE